MTRAAALVGLAGLSACGGEFAGTPISQHEHELVGASETSGYPSVGIYGSSAGVCTATLVGYQTVLTAGHCVTTPQGTFTIGDRAYSSKSVHPHPDYSQLGSTGVVKADIGVVLLSEKPDVEPTPISTKSPGIGQDVALVGFGLNKSGGTFGTKRAGNTKVALKTGGLLYYVKIWTWGITMCSGDSGGPSFAEIDGGEVQVGVHSRADMFCAVTAMDERVDNHVDWIKQVAGGDVFVDGSRPPEPAGSSPPARAAECAAGQRRACGECGARQCTAAGTWSTTCVGFDWTRTCADGGEQVCEAHGDWGPCVQRHEPEAPVQPMQPSTPPAAAFPRPSSDEGGGCAVGQAGAPPTVLLLLGALGWLCCSALGRRGCADQRRGAWVTDGRARRGGAEARWVRGRPGPALRDDARA